MCGYAACVAEIKKNNRLDEIEKLFSVATCHEKLNEKATNFHLNFTFGSPEEGYRLTYYPSHVTGTHIRNCSNSKDVMYNKSFIFWHAHDMIIICENCYNNICQ